MTNKLDPRALALGMGIPISLCFFSLGIASIFLPDYGEKFVQTVGSIYLGYTNTFSGSIIGALWAFIDFAIFGYLIGVIYNKFNRE